MELNRKLADSPTTAGDESVGIDLLGRHRLDAFTHARLWRNPYGFAARFNYLGLRYNTPLYGWVEERFGLSRAEFVVMFDGSAEKHARGNLATDL